MKVFYIWIKKEGLSKQDITELVENQQELRYMETRVELYHDYIRRKQSQLTELENEINRLKACR
jgi:ubiquinone biosynthesis protein Coq4